MKIYKTVREVYEFNLDEKNFLKYLKMTEPNDEEVQKAETFNDLMKMYTLDDFEEELDNFLSMQDLYASHTGYYDNKDEAYEDMEFGIH